MKLDPKFPPLPSIGELLKHPAVERVVQRVNQTTIAQKTAGFLDELRSSLKSHAGQAVVPSIQQLAERLARRLLGDARHNSPVINATGVVLGSRWPAPPLADDAIHEMLRLASEYHDTDQGLREHVAKLLAQLTGAEFAWVASSMDGAATIAREHDDWSIDVARHVGLLDPAQWGLPHVDTISERLARGAELVIFDGGGLLGGPRCGLVVGKRQRVEALAQHPLAGALTAHSLTLAALEATLEIYRGQDRVVHQIPVFQLLSAPLENLQQRGQRLSPLMEQSAAVARSEPCQCESAWYDAPETRLVGPSWAVALHPAQGSVQDLARQLQEAAWPVVGREEQGALLLDLRSVFPRWDQQLVAAVEDLPVAD